MEFLCKRCNSVLPTPVESSARYVLSHGFKNSEDILLTQSDILSRGLTISDLTRIGKRFKILQTVTDTTTEERINEDGSTTTIENVTTSQLPSTVESLDGTKYDEILEVVTTIEYEDPVLVCRKCVHEDDIIIW